MVTRTPGGASSTRFFAAIAAALVMAAVSLSGRLQQPPAQQQPPAFRAGVNLVRVDVYPTTKDGQHVGNLTAADFEVQENGAPQRIATFEHIVVQRGGTRTIERVDPGSTREERQAVTSSQGRLFVLLFDTAHVTDPTGMSHGPRPPLPGGYTVGEPAPPLQQRMGPPQEVDKALALFLERMLGPDDLIAVMTTFMDPRRMVFVRRPASIEEFLRLGWAERLTANPADPDDARFAGCSWPIEIVAKRREERAMLASRDLVRHLSGLREERKNVLLISEGWMLFPRQNDVGPGTRGGQVPAPPGVRIGQDGIAKLETNDPMVAARNSCNVEAARVSQIESERTFRDLLDEANRANTTFYPIDPRGLAAMDAGGAGKVPEGKDPALDGLRDFYRGQGYTAAQVEALSAGLTNMASLRTRIETLQTLATATDGVLTLNNDLKTVVERIADDLSAYYLIGYTPTNTKTDGSYRRISVRVKRSGVEVRARRGYLAPTKEEAAAASAPPPAVDAEAEAIHDALAMLARARDDMPFVAEAGQGCAASEGGAPTAAVWVAGEVTSAGARDAAWQPGAVADVTLVDPTGRALGTRQVTLSPPTRAFLLTFATGAVAGDQTVRLSARATSGTGMPVTQTLRVSVAAPGDGAPCIGTARLQRRGPFSGPAFVPTVDPRFRRQERAQIEVPVAGAIQATAARLLDRTGKALTVSVTLSDRQDGPTRWLGADAVLAPLAPGEYVLQLDLQQGATRQQVLKAIRIIP